MYQNLSQEENNRNINMLVDDIEIFLNEKETKSLNRVVNDIEIFLKIKYQRLVKYAKSHSKTQKIKDWMILLLMIKDSCIKFIKIENIKNRNNSNDNDICTLIALETRNEYVKPFEIRNFHKANHVGSADTIVEFRSAFGKKLYYYGVKAISKKCFQSCLADLN